MDKPGGELLLEIGVEEVPAFLVRATLDQLRDRASGLFTLARLEAREVRSYGTPRRLVLSALLPDRQQPLVTEVTGPPAAVAFDAAGRPTAAAEGFAKAQGVKVTDLQVVKTGKGDYVGVRVTQPALPTAKVLRQLLPTLVGQLQFPKTMRWNTSGGHSFIRPISWIVALLDRHPVPFVFAGVKSGVRTYGHRALAPKAITIRQSSDYLTQLRRAFVLVDDKERRGEIDRQVKEQESALNVMSRDNESVVSQAVYSCEWPVVAKGAFDEAYLDLPTALRLAVLRQQQGYLPLMRPNHGKVPIFLCILDGVSKQFMPGKQPKSLEAVVRNHERVLRARLEDARFYLKQDLAVTLSDRIASLKGVTFHEKLGTVYDKTQRVKRLVAYLAQQCQVDQKEAERAAELCKADLVTGLVREFPELQGVIGAEYARHQGDSPMVEQAIGEHYQPRSTGDALPDSQLGKLLSLADKIDTLVGYFGVGLAPTGSEDPYALRRQAAGVAQIAERFSHLDLTALLAQANHLLKSTKGWRDGTAQAVRKFLEQRVEWQLLSEGHRQELVAAVLAGAWNNPADARRWLTALEQILATPAGEDLLTVYRRVGRIVPAGFSGTLRPEQFTEAEERQLHEASEAAGREIAKAVDAPAALIVLARLRPAVDAFFNTVMVMAEDQAVQTNRLALVDGVRRFFVPIADFSKISTASPSAPAAPTGRNREV